MVDKKVFLRELEDKLNTNFKNKNLLIEALTHSSCINQNKEIKYNERLEFLGDSVLQLCISEYLFKNCESKSEGELTKIRALIVCENSLFEVAQVLNLGKYIFMSKGEELTGGRSRPSILADCVEAIIAAIYLDNGIQKVKDFLGIYFKNIIYKAINNEIVLDYKTKLQETLQQNGEVSILYTLTGYEGPPHRRKFSTEVLVDNVVKGRGVGYSKKEAEQNAAKQALTQLEGKYE
ncbi:ribonuclease III [Clostridium sp. SYSU_GA19001]|uniref:ribonuclease III n=1 Tax=Clostridium caldaquaticum TaxID=2940653 RepID=UPI002076EC34|nr:ribonuclease III [Clostridium caldaquaticum]MCM8710594.1 ribonuclease III [Clostridium caldaquaticum]